jgi:nitrate reductase NapD
MPHDVAQRLRSMPGVDLGLSPGDGRMVAVIEDATNTDGTSAAAAATLGTIATWPGVLSTSLVFEYSGPDSPAPEGSDAIDYRRWREALAPRARQQPDPDPSKPPVTRTARR